MGQVDIVCDGCNTGFIKIYAETLVSTWTSTNMNMIHSCAFFCKWHCTKLCLCTWICNSFNSGGHIKSKNIKLQGKLLQCLLQVKSHLSPYTGFVIFSYSQPGFGDKIISPFLLHCSLNHATMQLKTIHATDLVLFAATSPHTKKKEKKSWSYCQGKGMLKHLLFTATLKILITSVI